MKSLELLPEAAELVVFSLGAAGLSLFGTYFERFALTSLQHGDLTVGAWAGCMGLAVLFLAYRLGTDEVVPKLVTVVQTVGDAR